MIADQGFIHVVGQNHPAFFHGVVQADGAHFLGEFEPVGLLGEHPGRIAAASHLHFPVFLAPPAAFGKRARKVDDGVDVFFFRSDRLFRTYAQKRELAVDLRAVEAYVVGAGVAAFGLYDKVGHLRKGNFRHAAFEGLTFMPHGLAVCFEGEGKQFRVSAFYPCQPFGMEGVGPAVE